MFFNCIRITATCVQRVNHQNCITSAMRLQKYSDWYHRQPVRIVNEEEILQHAEEAEGPHQYIGENNKKYTIIDRKPLRVRPQPKQLKKQLRVSSSDITRREDGSFHITELKENDKQLTSLMMSVRSKKTRVRNSKIILEGRRLIEDAINSGAIPEVIVFSRKSDVMKLSLPEKGVKLFKVPYRAIQTWSTLVTPSGLMGFFQMPDVEKIKPAENSLPLSVICDNIRDPGNMGSILRAAAAVGCKKLITLHGCVDIWDPKVLKTAAGCHFRLPIFISKTWEEVSTLIDPYGSFYVADNNTLVMTDKTDESNDLSTIVDENETDINTTDLEKKVEGEEEDEEDVEVEAEGSYDTDDVQIKKPKTNYQRVVESKIARKLISNVPVIPYYSSDYTQNENIVIIGGETLGLSLEALELVKEKYGVRLNIPMTNGVDSLNTGMALGIIAYEIKRQHDMACFKNN